MLDFSGSKRLARVTVKLKHISWRDGRPRFTPGSNIRALGVKSEDLRHPTGAWFTLAETQDWLGHKLEEIEDRQKARAEGKRLAPVKRQAFYTIEQMFEDLWKAQRFKVAREASGLSDKTIADYRKKANALASFDPELYTSPAAAVTQAIAKGLHEKLWAAKGLHMANGMLAVLRLAFSEAILRGRGGLKINPCFKLKLPTPKPRLRIATAKEIEALMAAADAIDPEIGDAIMLGLYTGQREGDVLQLVERQERKGRIRLIQEKTNARVSMRALPPLMARIHAALERRAAIVDARREKATNSRPYDAPLTIVVDNRTGRSFNEDSFRHRFAEVRAKAAEACPSVESLHFADLRDTAVTRLAWAGCTIPEIASITGHSLASIHAIMKHYLELDEAHADNAMAKLEVWLEREGIEL